MTYWDASPSLILLTRSLSANSLKRLVEVVSMPASLEDVAARRRICYTSVKGLL